MTITHDNTLTNKQKYMDATDYTAEKGFNKFSVKFENKWTAAKLVRVDKLEELKRLQLEIDKAEANKKWLMQESFGREFDRSEDIEFQCSDLQIHTNTARIAEIILNEL